MRKSQIIITVLYDFSKNSFFLKQDRLMFIYLCNNKFENVNLSSIKNVIYSKKMYYKVSEKKALHKGVQYCINKKRNILTEVM